MKLKDVFDYRWEMFGYAWIKDLSVDGFSWPINYGCYNRDDDMLSLNSNRYKEYIYNYFFKDLEKLFVNKKIAYVLHPMLELREDDNGIKTLNISYVSYLKNIIDSINSDYLINNTLKNISLDNMIKFTKNAVLNEKTKYNDVLNKKDKSRYYSYIMNEHYQMTNVINIPLDTFIKLNIGKFNEYMVVLNNIKPILNKNFNINEFIDCFDYDQLMMIICKSFLDYNVDFSKKVGEADYCVSFIIKYIEAVKKLKQLNPDYDCSIMMEHEKLTLDSLIKQYDEFYSTLDDSMIMVYNASKELFQKNNVTVDDLKDLNPREFTDLIIMLNNKEMVEDDNQNNIQNDIKEINDKINSTKDNALKLKLIQQKEKIEFLLNNKPVKILHGLNSFANYYGYVYDNGYVVFDVLDKNINKSYGNAMYIMAYDKVNTYSSMSKSELRNSNFSDVSIIMHTNNWKERLLNKIKELESRNIDISTINSIDINKITSIEELKELEDKLLYFDETKKEMLKEKERRIKVYEQIDNELKQEDKEDISDEEFSRLSEDLIQEENNSFEELYNKSKKGYKRNPAVAIYTKQRARDDEGNYQCELCHIKSYHSSSFDSHHMIELSKGGVDNIYNTVCLCPNCHRDYHSNRLTYNQLYELYESIRNNLIKYNIEYLPLFEKMISPNTEDEKYYLDHKEEEDKKFAISWNYTRKLYK